MNFKKYVDSGDDVTGGAFIDVKDLNKRRKSTARHLETNGEEARKSRYFFFIFSLQKILKKPNLFFFSNRIWLHNLGRALRVQNWVKLDQNLGSFYNCA